MSWLEKEASSDTVNRELGRKAAGAAPGEQSSGSLQTWWTSSCLAAAERIAKQFRAARAGITEKEVEK